jgi:hypothetical protein
MEPHFFAKSHLTANKNFIKITFDLPVFNPTDSEKEVVGAFCSILAFLASIFLYRIVYLFLYPYYLSNSIPKFDQKLRK